MPTVLSSGTLRRGNHSDAVVVLQRALASLGYSVLPDSYFGPVTELAVKSFQASKGLTVDGVMGPSTARDIDLALGIAFPADVGDLIYIDLMYGLGDASTSAGMDVLAASLRALSPKLVVSPTVSWTERDALAARIRARNSKRNMLMANSMGANAIPMVTNACPDTTFELIAGYDATIFWSCPPFRSNVLHGILYHGMNWLNPIGHALYYPAFPDQIETVETYTLHQNVDDDLALHRHTIAAVQARLAA